MRTYARAIAVVFFVLTACLGSARGQTSEFRLHSESGDFIGNGLNYSFSTANGSFYNPDYDPPGEINLAFASNDADPSAEWFFGFASPTSPALTTGTYRNVQIQVAQGPISYNVGTFVVRQITYDSNGLLTSAWVTFVEYEPGATAALYGDLRYNATTDAPAGPILDAGQDQSTDSGNVALHGKAWEFVGKTGVRPPTRWSVVSGPGPVKFGNPASLVTTASMMTPGTYVLRLTAGSGASAAYADMNVTYTSKSTSLWVADGVRAGVEGGMTFLTPADGSFTVQGGTGGVEVDYPSPSIHLLNFSPPAGTSLTTGTYTGAVKYPVTSGSAPGLTYWSNLDGYPSTITGSFVIRELTLDSSNNVTSFWADFTEYLTSTSPPITGEIRVNADASSAFVPGSYAGFTSGLGYVPGYASLTMSPTGAFTGAFEAEETSHHVVRGVISAASATWSGLATSTPSLGVLTTEIQINGDGTLCGLVEDSSGNETTLLLKRTAPVSAFASLAGNYTLALSPETANEYGPSWGYGIGLATVDSRGGVRIAGALPDGRDLIGRANLAFDGSIPFYQTYRRIGEASGWVQFADLPASDFTGKLDWEYGTVENTPDDLQIDTTLDLVGSRWNPAYILPGLGDVFPNAQALFTDPNWPSSVTLNLDIGTKITVDGVRLPTLSPHPGVWVGAFVDPGGYGVDEFVTVFVQKQNMGFGLLQVVGGREPGSLPQEHSFHPVTITPN